MFDGVGIAGEALHMVLERLIPVLQIPHLGVHVVDGLPFCAVGSQAVLAEDNVISNHDSKYNRTTRSQLAARAVHALHDGAYTLALAFLWPHRRHTL